jgi:hypothetical protein
MGHPKQKIMNPGDAESRTPLSKILQVMGVLGVFVSLGSLTLHGLSLEELMLPAVALGLPIYLVVLVDPIIGLAILIACIGLSPSLSIGGIRDLRAEDFMLPGLLLGWLIRAGKERTRVLTGPLWVPAMVSMVVIVIATIAGTRGRGVAPSMPYLIMAKYAEYLIIYLVVLNSVRTPGDARALACFSVLVALTTAVISLSGSTSVVVDATGNRLMGPTGETSNIYGGYLGLNLLVALGIFLHSTSPGARLAWGTVVAVLGFAILFTYSRATYVAVAGAMLLFGAVKYRRLLVILVILAAIIPILAPSSVTDRLATVGGVASGTTPQSWSARLAAWEWVLDRMSATDRVLGMGIGSVAFGDVDSEYVRVFSDLGVIGLGLFAWVLIRIGRLANRTYDALEPDTFPKGYLAGYLMALLSLMIHAIAATTFSAIRTEETFMVLTGLMTVIACRQEELYPEETPDRPVVLLRDASILETPQR